MLLRGTITVAAALLCAAALGGCGDDGPKRELSSDRAATLRAALEEVEQGVRTGDCTQAAQQASSFRSRVEGLPERVDRDLRQALSASAGRLETLVADQCRPEPAPVEEPPAGTTTEEDTPQPEGDQDQPDEPKKDKPPKDEKPKDEEPPPDTGGAGEEDPTLDEQGGGGVPPGQE